MSDSKDSECSQDGEWNMQITTSSQPVDNAISQIEELANNLLSTVNFTEEVHENFQQLAASLVELETDRLRLHDELEVQSINASVKRYALQTHPGVYQKELEEAVLAARKGNEDLMRSLKAKLTAASDKTEDLVKLQQSLQLENTKLIPESEQVSKQHDEIIAALNQRMADKASKQIRLNETKDTLRETVGNVDELDIGFKNLTEDMEEFNKISQAEEEELRREVAETEDAIAKQNEKNKELRRTTDQLLDQIMDMNSKISTVRKDVRHTENAKARLEMQSMQLAEKISREKIINQQTAEDIAILQSEKKRQSMDYAAKIEELENKATEAESEVMGVQEKYDTLSKEKDNVFLNKEEAVRKKGVQQASLREAARLVMNVKRATTAMIEKAAHLTQENNHFQDDMMNLAENHNATVDTYNQQITEYRVNLDSERVERIKAQDEREETEKVLDGFKSDQMKFMNEMTQKIEEGRRNHKKLAQESAELNHSIAMNKKRTGGLKNELQFAERSYELMIKELEMEIERLKTRIELFTTENQRKGNFIGEKEPVLKDLDEELDSTGKEFSTLKNEVVAIRNREKSVQEQVKRTNLMLSKLVRPNEKLKADLKACGEKNVSQLQKSAKERKELETEMYDRTQKLENVVAENERFKLSCEKKVNMVKDIGLDMTAHAQYQSMLHKDLKVLQDKFMAAWEVCISMERASAVKDEEILQGIDELQQETKARCTVLTDISDQLHLEMESLTGFLNNVNSRRPKDTRQDRRKSIKPTPPPTSQTGLRRKSTRSPSFAADRRSSRVHPTYAPGVAQA